MKSQLNLFFKGIKSNPPMFIGLAILLFVVYSSSLFGQATRVSGSLPLEVPSSLEEARRFRQDQMEQYLVQKNKGGVPVAKRPIAKSGNNVANDEPADAEEIVCGTPADGTNVGATQSDESQYPDNLDVWYKFSPAATQKVTIATCGAADFDTKIEVFDAALDRIAANDDGADCDNYTSRVVLLLYAGEEYYISVGGHQGQTGNFTLSLTCEDLTVLEGGYTCETAVPLLCNTTIIGSTLDAIDPVQSGAPGTAPGGFDEIDDQAPGKWYTFTMDENTYVRLNTCNSNTDYDTDIEVYWGGPCAEGGPNLVPVKTSDFSADFCFDGGNLFSADVVFYAEAGIDYKIFVNGYVNPYSGPFQGTYELTVTCAADPCDILDCSFVQGLAWDDQNGDGIQDEGEGGFENVQVQLYNDQDDLLATTTTASDGAYSFSLVYGGYDLFVGNIADYYDGDYYVVFENVPGYYYSPKDQTSDDKDSDVQFNRITGEGISDLFSIDDRFSTVQIDAGLTSCPPLSEVGCNDNVKVTLDENCEALITPDMILEGNDNYICYKDLVVDVIAPGDISLGSVVPSGYAGMELIVSVTDPSTGYYCWGTVTVEDKTAPAFDCTPAEITQIDGRDLYCTDLEGVLGGSLVLPAPTVTDNCDDDVRTWYEDELNEGGDCGETTITRTWYAEDGAGNEAEPCVQIIRFSVPTLDDVAKPDDEVEVACDFTEELLKIDENNDNVPDYTLDQLLDENGHPTPLALELLHGEGAGYPYVGGRSLNEAYCNLGADYEDISVIEVCENTYKIVRQWTILDWCDVGDQDDLNNGTLVNHRQVIKFGDFEAPVLTDPGVSMTIGTEAFGCEGELTIPGLDSDQIHENCSTVTVEATLYKTTIEPVFDQYGRPDGEAPVTVDLGSVAIGSTVDVEVGPTYTIKYIATDACGNVSNEVDLEVTVEDDTAPTAACDDDLHISLGGQGRGRLTPADVDEGSWDNCGDFDLWLSRKLATEDLRDAYLAFVYDGLTFDELVLSGLDDKDNDSDADIYVVDEDGDGVWDSNETHEVLRYKDEMWFTWWRDEISFICEDTAERVVIELLAEDTNGNTNVCWNDVLVEDKIRPVCDVAPTVTLDCTELPYGFDPADPDDVAALPGVTGATAGDNCHAEPVLDTVLIVNWNCNSGVIERYFSAIDDNGLTSVEQCVQTITVNPVSNYEIIFPADPDPVVCGDAVLDTIETNIIACDLLTVNVVNDTFTASGTACYKIKRTYSVINWCEYDGEASPVEIGRDEDGDGTTGEHDVYVLRDAVMIDGYNVYIDDDVNEKDVPLRKTVSTGYWTYIQYIKVIDNIAPVVAIGGDDVFCSYDNVDCDGEVIVPFTVTDECTGDDIVVKVFVDGNQVDLEEDDYPNYSIKEVLGWGEHEIEIHAIDGCGNSQLETKTIRVADCKAPSPICINGLAVELMQTEPGTDVDGDGEDDPGVMVIWATDFEVSSGEDCTGPVRLSIHRVDETPHPDSSRLTLTCKDPDTLTVRIYAWDNADSPIAVQPGEIEPGGPNYDYCETYVVVQDNLFGLCDDPGRISIAGLIENEVNETVENVSVSLSGLMSDNTLTPEQGTYAFTDLTLGGDYTITPQKDDDYLNGVSTFDLVLITKHILGTKRITSPYKMIAADVNSSRSITALDLIHQRKLILSIYKEFPNNTSWRFIPKNYEFPDPTNPWAQDFPEVLNYNNLQEAIANGDFVGVKIGDVNDNAIPNRRVADERNLTGTFRIQVADQEILAGNEYRVPFTVDQLNVQGYQFTLNYEGLTLTDIEYGVAQAENFGLIGEHVLTTSWHLDQPALAIDDQNHLFTLVVRADKNARLSDLLRINSHYTQAEAYDPADELLDVALNFDSRKFSGKDGFYLEQNVPNPFTENTRIGFVLPKAMEATINIQDVNGSTLQVIRREFGKGYNTVDINGSNLPATGVLFYTLKTEDFTATRKMILISE